MSDDDRVSLFQQAQAAKDRALVADVIQIVREYSDTWGRYPSLVEVLAKLQRPT